MTQLSVSVEHSSALASWLKVTDVALVREDLLPDGGGKKRRGLEKFAQDLRNVSDIHLLSYAGSHTAFSLSQMLPETIIHLYGTHYGGGAYESSMVNILNQQANVVQSIGSTLQMTRQFKRKKQQKQRNHHFMKIGGSLGTDPITREAARLVVAELDKDFHHFVAVASGDLLKNILEQTQNATGVLTQPPAIRILKYLTLRNSRGMTRKSLGQRMRIMGEICDLTGYQWDPIFMGSVFSYLKQMDRLPSKLCIWVTCPSGIDWIK